jgi:uncharacterized membrane protein YgcG
VGVRGGRGSDGSGDGGDGDVCEAEVVEAAEGVHAAAVDRGEDDDEKEEEEVEDDDDTFEHVSVCRRLTLAQLYTMLRPALQQISVDRVPLAAAATLDVRNSAAADVARKQGAPTPGLIDDDDGLCSICMDSALEVVTRCTHAFCEECYLRWLSLSRECPLCRERLGLELKGTNVGSYALVSWGDLLSPASGDDDNNNNNNNNNNNSSGGGGGGGGGGGNHGGFGGDNDAAARRERARDAGAAGGAVEGGDAATATDEARDDVYGGQRVDAAWLCRRLAALPSVSEPGRRAHQRWLLQSLREKQQRGSDAANRSGSGSLGGR